MGGYLVMYALWAGLLCSGLALSDGPDANRGIMNGNAPADTVHLVFSNHLDIGFDGIPPELGYDNVVINKYFEWYLPMAVMLGKWFDMHNGTESHIYTSHSYVISLYMNCPEGMGLNCPSLTEKEALKESIQKGHVTWTALPWNGQLELMDPFTLASAAHVSFYLDGDMNVPKKTVISQRDVPGMTRSSISVLVNEGIRAISVGVNGGSAPPDVPLNTPFIWRDQETDTQVIGFWHPFGYGGHIHDGDGYWKLTPPADCVRTPKGADGSRHILCFSWRQDNKGPYTDPDQVLHTFDLARKQFPGAQVIASTFEAFVDELEPFKDQFPEVTSEIGDTWIHGVASDPMKVSQYKAIMRMRSKCLLEESCTAQDPNFKNFTRLLLKIPEHTWGIDSKVAPANWDIWKNGDFQQALESNPLFGIAEKSWKRQRSYIDWSIQALSQSLIHAPLAAKLANTLDAQQVDHPAVASMLGETSHPAPQSACPDHRKPLISAPRSLLSGPTTHAINHGSWDVGEDRTVKGSDGVGCGGYKLETMHWRIVINSFSGKITQFCKKHLDEDGRAFCGTDWAAGGVFANIIYKTYNESVFLDWMDIYNPAGPASAPWSYDFGKPGSSSAGLGSREVEPTFVGAKIMAGPTKDEEVVVAHFRFQGWALYQAGAPLNVTLLIRSWPGSHSVALDVIWSGKAATRIPEATWIQFQPQIDTAKAVNMTLWKLGAAVSPLDIVRNGSHSLHAVGDFGVLLQSQTHEWETLQVASLDAPLVAIGSNPVPLPDPIGPADVGSGFSYCLSNNAWGTNYVMWVPYLGYGEHMKFRFLVTVRDTRKPLQATPHWHLSFDPHFFDLPEDVLL